MKNAIISMFFGIFGFLSISFAGPSFTVLDLDNPMELTGTTYTNTPYALVAHGDREDFSRGYWNDLDLSLIAKAKKNGTWEKESTIHDFSFSGPGNSGTWAYTGGDLQDGDNSNNFKLYFSVKARNPRSGGGFNLFAMNDNWYDNSLNAIVKWSTMNDFFTTAIDDLSGHDISHIAFWKGAVIPDNPNNPTPEPATMILFGFGLLGFAGVSRRKSSII